MSARFRSRDLTPINDWSEVPQFANEADEAEFWRTHSLGERLLDQMRPIDEVLPQLKRRRRRSIVLRPDGFSHEILRQSMHRDRMGVSVVETRIWSKAS